MRKTNIIKVAIGVIVILMVVRVIWVNLEYSRSFHSIRVPIGQTQYLQECGMDVCVEEIVVYTDISELDVSEFDYSEAGLNEDEQIPVPFALLQAWKASESPCYYLAVRVNFHNKSEEEAMAFLLQYEMYGSDWRQSPQIIFEKQVGDMDDYMIILKPDEQRSVQLLFRASDDKYRHTMYQDAGNGQIYLSYLGDHVRYYFSLSDKI